MDRQQSLELPKEWLWIETEPQAEQTESPQECQLAPGQITGTPGDARIQRTQHDALIGAQKDHHAEQDTKGGDGGRPGRDAKGTGQRKELPGEIGKTRQAHTCEEEKQHPGTQLRRLPKQAPQRIPVAGQATRLEDGDHAEETCRQHRVRHQQKQRTLHGLLLQCEETDGDKIHVAYANPGGKTTQIGGIQSEKSGVEGAYGAQKDAVGCKMQGSQGQQRDGPMDEAIGPGEDRSMLTGGDARP